MFNYKQTDSFKLLFLKNNVITKNFVSKVAMILHEMLQLLQLQNYSIIQLQLILKTSTHKKLYEY